VQWQQFFHTIPALDVLGIGLIVVVLALARQTRHGPDRWLWALLLHAAATWAFWIVVMFVPHSALVHHGSYVVTLSLLAAGAIGLARLRLSGALLLSVHLLVFVAAWVLPGGASRATWRPGWLVVGLAGLVLTAVVMALSPWQAVSESVNAPAQ
jgi:hypothetical protein